MNNINELLSDLKFQLHVKHPGFEECYVDGYECALAEMEETHNPYQEGTRESEQWLEGWWAGFYEEAPLFELTDERDLAPQSLVFAANDALYQDEKSSFLTRMLEITGAIAVTAFLGYQVAELVG